MKNIGLYLIFLLVNVMPAHAQYPDCERSLEIHAPFAKREVEIPLGGEVRLMADTESTTTYHWSNDWKTPVVFISDSGWVWVEMAIDGSTTRDSVHLHYADDCVQIPNAFAPNNGFRECLQQFECKLDSFQLYIYDRWGDPVFTTTDQTECWKGPEDNTPYWEGQYVFLVFWKREGSPWYKKMGTVMLMKNGGCG